MAWDKRLITVRLQGKKRTKGKFNLFLMPARRKWQMLHLGYRIAQRTMSRSHQCNWKKSQVNK